MGNQGSTLCNLLENSTVGELVESKQGKIITISSDNTINEAIQLMRENKIHSLPLREDRFNQDRGLVDVGDIVAFFSHVHQTNPQLKQEELKNFFLDSKVTAKLADFSHQNFCSAVKQQDNLLRLVRSLSGEDRLQRVILLDDNNNINNIIGQSIVLRFLYENCDMIKSSVFLNIASSLNLVSCPPTNVTAGELQSKRELLSINQSTTAIDAFYFLHDNKLRSVPIVDDDQRVVGNISASDITGLSYNTWDLLYEPVVVFLKGIEHYRTPITIQEGIKFRRLVGTLSENQIHHVYIVNEEKKVTGVVSVSDILLYLKNKHKQICQ